MINLTELFFNERFHNFFYPGLLMICDYSVEPTEMKLFFFDLIP